MTKFTYPWFDITAKANFEKFLGPLKDKPNLNFLEIGCFEGMATVWMLKNILTDQTSKINVIDTFEGSMEHGEIDLGDLLERFETNIEPFKNKVHIWKGFSQDVVRRFGPESQFDFVYVDGSHMAEDVLEDAILSFKHLKSGGIMILDDYGWHKYENNLLNPGPGIDAFLNVFADKIKVLGKEYQVIIQKL